MAKQRLEMLWRYGHSAVCIEAWWKIANMLLGLFVNSVEQHWWVGYIFGNQCRVVLMQESWC